MKNALVFSQSDACNFSIYIIRTKGVPSLTNAVKGRREGTGRLKLVGVKMTEGVCHMYFDACRNYTISHLIRDF